MLAECVGLLLLWISAARAQELVVRAELSAPAATAQVAEDAARPSDGLRAVTLPELLVGRPPVVLGQGSVELCRVEPMAATAVAEASRRAESNVLYVEYDAAMADIEAATRALGCLKEHADPRVASRLYYLRGLIAWQRGDAAQARIDFRQAHVYDPALAWDANFPPSGKAPFEEAARDVAASSTVLLDWLPVPDGVRVLVDGVEVADPGAGVHVRPGEHLVQLVGASISTIRVRVEGGPATLFVPNAVPESLAREVEAADAAPVLARVLAASTAPGQPVYVALPTGTWRGAAGEPAFERLATRDPHRGRRVAKRVLLGSGGAVFVAGGALAGASFLQATSLARAAPNGTWDEYQAAVPRYERAKTRLTIGEAAAASGVVLLGVGLVLPVGGP